MSNESEIAKIFRRHHEGERELLRAFTKTAEKKAREGDPMGIMALEFIAKLADSGEGEEE